MDIQINYDYRKEDLEKLPLHELTQFVLAREDKPFNTEVSISFVTDEAIAELNERYRHKEVPTDVLSFECDGVDDDLSAMTLAEDPVYELGDVVIAPDVASRQTREFGTTFEEEISLLLVHGLLHLCGYDHIEDDEAEVMEKREAEILEAWLQALRSGEGLDCMNATDAMGEGERTEGKPSPEDGAADGVRFVRNRADKDSRARFSLGRAFSCAWEGVVYTARTQRNMKIHFAVGAAAVLLGAALGIDAASWAAIVICIVLVLAAECLNTAVESVVDLVSPDYAELAKHAKDCAAGAVLVCALGAVAVAAAVFVPRLAALFV